MLILEIAIVVILLTVIAWLFGLDGQKIMSFYTSIIMLCSIVALFAALTAYFLKLMGTCQ